MLLKINKKNISIILANTFFKRLFGLLGKKNINYGMLFKNCNAIHTLFMKIEINIIVFNNDNIILDIKYLKPFKFYKIKYNHKKTNILELPNNISFNYKIGDKLFFEDEHVV